MAGCCYSSVFCIFFLFFLQTSASVPDICLLPKRVGWCRAAIPRYFYNSETGACEQFTYGGCRGNRNNFRTLQACQKKCVVSPQLPVRSCPSAQCPMDCATETVRDPLGCEVCRCKAGGNINPFGRPFVPGQSQARPNPFRCGPVCMIYCPNGNVMDERGCPTCKCNPEPKPVCPPVCEIYCPNGNVKDSNGCPTCKCKPSIAEPMMCPMRKCGDLRCPNGLVRDIRGCTMCQCMMDTPRCMDASQMTCLKKFNCRFGVATDDNGCRTCACNAPPIICPVQRCLKPCPGGFEKDTRGCETCECKKPVCPVFKCRACPQGYVTDANGCQTCECKTPKCPSFHCRIYCLLPERFSARIRSCQCNC